MSQIAANPSNSAAPAKDNAASSDTSHGAPWWAALLNGKVGPLVLPTLIAIALWHFIAAPELEANRRVTSEFGMTLAKSLDRLSDKIERLESKP